MTAACHVAIVGAGPYGLSIAAHLLASGVSFRIFGQPMETWREHMPAGMLLKSDGFASSLSEPASLFTLKHFCQLHGIAYDDTRVPVALQTFVDYGLAFQRRFVSELDSRSVTTIEPGPEGFLVTLGDGEALTANRVVLAVGISHFAYVPENLASLPARFVTHSSDHKDPESYRGQQVAVIGAGASAIDLAVLLHEAGASVTLVARRMAVVFHDPPPAQGRSLAQRLRHPSSGLGPGWKSRLYTDFPGWFRYLPEDSRLRIVRQHLGPAPGWPMKERIAGKIPMHLGVSNLAGEVSDSRVRLTFTNPDGSRGELLADHVVAATGYRVDLRRLAMLHERLRVGIRAVENAPVLSANFESSVRGLYFVGIAAANTFGPMMRFAYGAAYTARKLARHLASGARGAPAPAAGQAEVATR
jgi:Pyridine nucleotide-disulphide oxidoreductase